jgi:uncharacterized OB-fold protein
MTTASGPVPDEDSAPYWAGLRERRIQLQKCAVCGEVRFPRMPACPACGSPAWEELAAAGTGRVYSWIVVHRPLGTLTPEDLPCTLATVELDEGCRVLARLTAEYEVMTDLPVTADFVDHGEWTELVFLPAVQA